jgi:hypothetical protein
MERNIHLAFDRGKTFVCRAGRQGFVAKKYYPKGGDLFVQTRKAWPFLTRGYKFALAKAK